MHAVLYILRTSDSPCPLWSSLVIASHDQSFLEALAELAYCNPFSRRRLELEELALGDDYDASDTQLWSRTLETDVSERPNVARLTDRADRIAEQLRASIDEGEKLDERTLELYDALVPYVLYYRHVAGLPFCEASGPDHQAVLQPAWKAFFESYQRFFATSTASANDRAAAAHLFACLYQVRRAFRHIFDCILGESVPVARLRETVWQSIFTHDMRRYRRSLYGTMRELPTLITGPSGTGKELVARAIASSQYLVFDADRQRFVDEPTEAFMPLNLSALSPTLIESELFGHARGSFTGATADRVGWLEACRPHGAVFLDEIGDLDLTIQVKLLRVVQHRTYCRLGETQERTFNGKIVAATNRDLAEEIEAGRFRHDFYYRLCADRIETPSLSEQLADRPQALGGLIHFIAERIAPGEAEVVAAEAEMWIHGNMPTGYSWPGNIRELEQCVRNVLVRREYTPRHEPKAERTGWLSDAEEGRLSADQLLAAYTTWVYAKLGTYEAVAKQLGVDRRTVKSKIDEELLSRIRQG